MILIIILGPETFWIWLLSRQNSYTFADCFIRQANEIDEVDILGAISTFLSFIKRYSGEFWLATASRTLLSSFAFIATLWRTSKRCMKRRLSSHKHVWAQVRPNSMRTRSLSSGHQLRPSHSLLFTIPLTRDKTMSHSQSWGGWWSHTWDWNGWQSREDAEADTTATRDSPEGIRFATLWRRGFRVENEFTVDQHWDKWNNRYIASSVEVATRELKYPGMVSMLVVITSDSSSTFNLLQKVHNDFWSTWLVYKMT